MVDVAILCGLVWLLTGSLLVFLINALGIVQAVQDRRHVPSWKLWLAMGVTVVKWPKLARALWRNRGAVAALFFKGVRRGA